MPEEQIFVRNLAISFGRVGDILRGQEKSDCLAYYEQAVELYRRIGDPTGEAARAFNLGHAYKNVASIRDLDKAEIWYKKSLAMRPDSDRLSGAQCLGQLGSIELERVEVGFRKRRAVEANANDFTGECEVTKLISCYWE